MVEGARASVEFRGRVIDRARVIDCSRVCSTAREWLPCTTRVAYASLAGISMSLARVVRAHDRVCQLALGRYCTFHNLISFL